MMSACLVSSAATHSLDSLVIAGLDPAIQYFLDARVTPGHDMVNRLNAPVH